MFRGIYDKQYGATEPSKLFSLAKANVSFVQRLKLYRSLEVHSGCVNTVCWNETGSYILSGADDQHLSVTNPFTGKKCFSIRSGHRANIFSAKFLPSTADKQIISCSGDGKIFYTEVERDDTYGTNCFDCHYGTAYEVTTLPGESSTFLSCGEDGTVRWFDLRMKTSCSKDDCKEDVMINCRRPVTSLSVNPVLPYQLGVACSDSAVRIFDRRMLGTRLMGNYSGRGITGLVCRFTAKSSESRAYRITSLQYSPDGEELLVSYSSEHLYLFSTKNEKARNFEKEVRTPPEPIQEETSFKESVEAVCSAKPETTTATTPESTVPCIPSTSKEPPEVEIAEDTPVAPPTSEETATPEEGATAGTTDPTAKQPPIKRLRLRGDWSDTGPNARPESERQEDEDQSPHVTLMQRMSDMLTRWLDSRPNTQGGEARESVQEEPEQRGETSEQGEPPPEGAVGGDATLPDLTKSRKIAVQENPELIQGLEDMQVPSGSQMDITDRLRNLSKTYQEQKAACIQGRVPSRAADDSFKLSTSPFPVDRIEESSEDAMTVLHAETESSMTLSKAEESSSTLLLNDETSSAIFGKDEEKQSRVVSDKIEELSSNSTAADNVSFLSQPEGNVEASGSSDVSCGTATTTTAASEVMKKDSEKTPSNSAQNWVEPVLNLHYSTQGTTSSTIQFGFASFQPDSCLSRTTANRELSGSSSFTGDSQVTNILSRDRTEHILGANISQGESPVILNSKSIENENTSAVPSIVSESSPIHEVDITQQKSENSSNTGEISKSELDTQDLEDKSSNRTEDIAMAVVIKADTECENVNRTNDSCVDESVSRCDQAETGAAETSTENIEERSIKGDDSDKPECDQVSGVALPETETSATSGLQDAGAAASESRPPRQRRIGRSGPPTGDFQLYSPPGGDSSDDSHGEGQAARRRANWDDSDELERNVAAIRLQSFYRQKHAEREEKELEANQVFQPKVKRKFRGHRNARTMIKEANFWGDHYVMSGSDCGHIFMWDRETAKLAMLLEADRHVVNCLQPHPFDPVLASSGIDYDIKVWAPLSPTPCFDEAAATEIMRRNELMLEETRDTITVPAAFMLRVLASLNHIRTGRSGNNESGSDTD